MNARQLREVLDHAGDDEASIRFSTVVKGIPRDLKPRESQITRRRWRPEERGELTPCPRFESTDIIIYLELQ